MTQIQAASISALPQQASREARSPAAAAAAADLGQIELQTSEKLEKSVEIGDRDAQEQYQSPGQNTENQAAKDSPSSQPTESDSNSIWNLSVADDQPPPDLDIRG